MGAFGVCSERFLLNGFCWSLSLVFSAGKALTASGRAIMSRFVFPITYKSTAETCLIVVIVMTKVQKIPNDYHMNNSCSFVQNDTVTWLRHLHHIIPSIPSGCQRRPGPRR
ncbi:MAG: hypothetical protein FD149_1284 [Rhodospirillaceae bacterium]|nr:MAG: hypothetical protein FD149_1284 [Rhodospirillaceae bacterium]